MRFLCLMYHDVCPDGGLASGQSRAALGAAISEYTVERSTFAQQLDLAAHYSQLFRPTDLTPTTLPTDKLGVLVTFDDGWLGSIDQAGPELEARNVTGLLFVTTDFLGSPLMATAAHLRSLPTKTLRVGSHSRSHRFLNSLTEPEIREELTVSKSILEEIVSYPVDTISIPNGAIDSRVLRIAQEVGYRHIFTSEPGLNRPENLSHGIRRMPVRRTTSLPTLQNWLTGHMLRERLRYHLLELPKRLLGPTRYRALRCRLLGESTDQFSAIRM